MITKKFLAILLAVSVFTLTGFSQDETKTSTKDETNKEETKTFTKDELDAVLEAGRFTREMQQIKDVRPLLIKDGVPNYGLWIPKSKEALDNDFLSPEFAAKVNPRLVQDLHIAVFNYFYLHSIWDLHQVHGDEEHEFLPEVMKIFKSDPLLSPLVEDESDGEKLISSASELTRTIKSFEQAANFYRGYLERFPKVKTKTYLSNLADITDDGEDLYQPHSDICDRDEGCFGVAKGTEYVDVTIEPRYVVILTRVAGKMKIVYLMPYMD